jgi:hypothetical protein
VAKQIESDIPAIEDDYHDEFFVLPVFYKAFHNNPNLRAHLLEPCFMYPRFGGDHNGTDYRGSENHNR